MKKKEKKQKKQDRKKTEGGLGLEELKKKGMKVYKFKFNLKKFLIWLLILVLFLPGLFSFLSGGFSEEITVQRAMQDIKSGKVKRAEVSGSSVDLKYSDTEYKTMVKEEGESFGEILERHEVAQDAVEYIVKGGGFMENLGGILNVLSFVLMGLFFLVVMRQAKGGGKSGMFGFGKSNAELFSKGKQDVTFDDVAGVDEAKKELEEVVDFLKKPDKYLKLGARTPKGVLLVGEAGVGKTLLAKAVAGEAGVPFFSIAGSEFMEMLVGVGASRTRDLFDKAKKAAPAIIFIDELDAIGRKRGRSSMTGHDEREQTLNQILVEMDGFGPRENVIVMSATNRPDVLDRALIRPGRFDRRVKLDMPDIQGRQEILKIHAKGKPFADEVTWEKVARRTVGFSGADLENMLNEAAIRAVGEGKSKIDMEDIEEAATKVKMGPKKRRLQSEKEREMTAYHEAGHAVVSHFLSRTDPVHRISIVSRGLALGFTMIPPAQDKYQRTRSELLEKIATLLGGRVAEEMIFGEMTVGAASDIDNVTSIARGMVVEYGMSKLGPVDFGPREDTTEWGRTFIEPSDISEEKKGEIDVEIKRIVSAAKKTAEEILKDNRDKMDKVVEKLMEVETVDREEFEELMGVDKEKAKEISKYQVRYK